MNNKQESKATSLSNIFWMFGQVWKYTPGYVIWMVAEGVIWGINHSLGIYYMEKLLSALGNGSAFTPIAKIILAYAVYKLFFCMFHWWYWGLYNPKMRQKLHVAMHSDLFAQATRIDLSKYDDPEFYNDFVWSMETSFNHVVGLMEDTGKLINRIFASVSLVGIIFSVDFTMAIIILASAIIQLLLGRVQNRLYKKQEEEFNPLRRKMGYIERVYKLPDYAKELRISRVCENLSDEFDDSIEKRKKIGVAYGKKRVLIDTSIRFLLFGVETGLMVLMLYKIMVTGEVALGGFAVAINACWKMSWVLRDMIDRITKYHEHGIFVTKMRRFLDTEPEIVSGSLEAPHFESIEIRNLAFAYPAKEHAANALLNVNMEIKRGEKIAIVGYNGAGKTTLTKLLMRLYDPTDGEIIYNGRNMKEYSIESLRGHMAAVFQDYRIFAATLAENVVGGSYEDGMEERVLDSLNRSTFTNKLEALTDGIATQLTREFDNSGTQLSGGEAQKVAIARAFFRNADFIILDEPSSALDPDAEYELNKAISQYAEDKTIVFISHRLSTTRGADKIYMFENGQIVESGNHESLMRQNGKYAYMFNLQAEKYRKQIIN